MMCVVLRLVDMVCAPGGWCAVQVKQSRTRGGCAELDAAELRAKEQEAARAAAELLEQLEKEEAARAAAKAAAGSASAKKKKKGGLVRSHQIWQADHYSRSSRHCAAARLLVWGPPNAHSRARWCLARSQLICHAALLAAWGRRLEV